MSAVSPTEAAIALSLLRERDPSVVTRLRMGPRLPSDDGVAPIPAWLFATGALPRPLAVRRQRGLNAARTMPARRDTGRACIGLPCPRYGRRRAAPDRW